MAPSVTTQGPATPARSQRPESWAKPARSLIRLSGQREAMSRLFARGSVGDALLS